MSSLRETKASIDANITTYALIFKAKYLIYNTEDVFGAHIALVTKTEKPSEHIILEEIGFV